MIIKVFDREIEDVDQAQKCITDFVNLTGIFPVIGDKIYYEDRGIFTFWIVKERTINYSVKKKLSWITYIVEDMKK